MQNILTPQNIPELISRLKNQNNKCVLIGGCFDILHIGHIIFLEKSKKAGDVLIILLESDKKIKELKGGGRPINSQITRARILSALKFVDYIIRLPYFTKDSDYEEIVRKLKPAFIATTAKDPNILYKIRAAKLVGAKVLEVTPRIAKHSSSDLAKQLFDNGF